jgi:hypothetical protein
LGWDGPIRIVANVAIFKDAIVRSSAEVIPMARSTLVPRFSRGYEDIMRTLCGLVVKNKGVVNGSSGFVWLSVGFPISY